MRNHVRWVFFGLLVLLAGSITVSGALAAMPARRVTADPAMAAAQAKIDSRLLSRWNNSPGSRADYIVWMAEQADTRNNIEDWAAKGEYVLRKLETTARLTQPAVKRVLDAQRGIGHVGSYQGYTIVNAVGVKGGSIESALAVAALPGVKEVRQPQEYRMDPMVAAPEEAASPDAWPYGIAKIQAPQVWAMGYRGDGVTIGSVDSGVRYTHEAVNRQYRGNMGGGTYNHDYNWWDSTTAAMAAPYDDDSHGTHTTGTVLGDNADPGSEQIGVAPHAKWIAAKVFPGGGSSFDTEILASMDFMLAPWPVSQPWQNRRPDLRPRVVNNSWGDPYCPYDSAWTAIQNWINAGIFPSFSAGNSGPAPGTAGAPGAFPHSFALGATSSTDTIAGFSSRGPSCWGVLKPDVSAPGVGVRSSVSSSDTAYASFNGTSMAAPHNTGLVALLAQVRPSLTISDMMAIITRTADFTETLMGTRPNNNYGWGRINAWRAAEYALHAPQITGTVHMGGTMLDRAVVRAVRASDGDERVAITAPDGSYKMTIGAGTYNVTVQAFGFDAMTVSGQSFLSDTNYSRHFDMTRSAINLFQGRVLQEGTSTPMSATITVVGSPHVYHSDATSGQFRIALPSGTWTLHINGGLYSQRTETITIDGPLTRDIIMRNNCDAMYCSGPVAYNWITATTQITSFTPYFGGVPAEEEGYAQIALPFSFNYYGTDMTSIYADTNSLAAFEMPAGEDNTYVNTRIPSTTSVNSALYVYWFDTALYPVGNGNQGRIYTEVTGSAPNRTFVLEYRDISSMGGTANYEIQLKEGSNEVHFVYQDVAGAMGYGLEAAIGIENQTGTMGIESAFEQPGQVGNGMAIRYYPMAAGPTPTPMPTQPPCTITFTDVNPTDYFYQPVRYLYCAGAISGYSDNTFRPFNNTTRGQLTKIVVLGMSIPLYTPPTPTFSDVPADHPFYQYVETAVHEGIVSGYSDGTFRPQNNVTRGQLSKIIVEAAGWTLLNPSTPTFSDVPTDHPFYQYIETAYDHRIISGYADGTFKPFNDATRGQISKIVYLAVIAP